MKAHIPVVQDASMKCKGNVEATGTLFHTEQAAAFQIRPAVPKLFRDGMVGTKSFRKTVASCHRAVLCPHLLKS